MQTSANQTKGHSAVNPGLRGHSCGENYPLTVIGQGAPVTQYRVFNCSTGRVGTLRHSYREAEIDLYSIRLRNLMHS